MGLIALDIVKKNTIANYVGTIWSALMGLAFIPLYIHYLGAEAFGLISLFGLIQSALVLLDFGLAPTLLRVMSQFSSGLYSRRNLHDILRSIEVIYLIVAIFGFIVVAFFVDDLWRGNNSSIDDIKPLFILCAVMVSARFLSGLYKNGMQGLQAQVVFNFIHIIFSSLRGPGVLIFLVFYSATLEVFFYYQGIISVIEVLVLRYVLHRLLPRKQLPPHFNYKQLKKISSFALSTAAGVLLLFCISNTDRALLFNSVSLEEFGYYSIALVVSNALFLLTMPINDAFQPRLTVLASQKNQDDVWVLYEQGTKALGILTGPIALIIAFYPEYILFIWGQSDSIIKEVSTFIRFLIIGALFYNLNHMSRILSLAYGESKVLVVINSVALLFFFPLEWFLVERYGALGASIGWLVLNFSTLISMPMIIHYKLFGSYKIGWYFNGFLPILFGCAVILYLSLYFIPSYPSSLYDGVVFMASLVVILYSYVLIITKDLRELIAYHFPSFKSLLK